MSRPSPGNVSSITLLTLHSMGALAGAVQAAHGLFYDVAQAVRCVAMGGFHTVAVADTSVFAWGCNDAGQLGTGDFADRRQPIPVAGLAQRHVTAVACGASHTLFLCKCGLSITRPRMCMCLSRGICPIFRSPHLQVRGSSVMLSSAVFPISQMLSTASLSSVTFVHVLNIDHRSDDELSGLPTQGWQRAGLRSE
jgi:Regulator of chromosome condensation (RCC1) repeat